MVIHPSLSMFVLAIDPLQRKIVEILRDNFSIIIEFYNSETESILMLN
jgi:hypothetical protein